MHIHMIQNGENLFSISSKYKLSASRLIEENQLASPYETLIGQSLICTHPSRMHTVKGGENVASICNTYHISPRMLLQQNPSISQNSALFPGQIIVVTPESPMFGALCVCGYLEEGVNPNSALLPYLTTLTLEGCKIENGKILLPSIYKSAEKEQHISPVFLAGIKMDGLHSFFSQEQGNAETLIRSLKENDLGGIDVNVSHFPSFEMGELLLHLRRKLMEEGLCLWLNADETLFATSAGEKQDLFQLADGVLVRDRGNMSFSQRVEALYEKKSEGERYPLFPSLPTGAYETVTLMSKEKICTTLTYEEAIQMAQKRAESIVRAPKSHLATYTYTSGVGRRRKQHRVYMEDPFSFWLGMLEMNRRGVTGVTVNAAATPISFLLMLSLKWHLLDGKCCRRT